MNKKHWIPRKTLINSTNYGGFQYPDLIRYYGPTHLSTIIRILSTRESKDWIYIHNEWANFSRTTKCDLADKQTNNPHTEWSKSIRGKWFLSVPLKFGTSSSQNYFQIIRVFLLFYINLDLSEDKKKIDTDFGKIQKWI